MFCGRMLSQYGVVLTQNPGQQPLEFSQNKKAQKAQKLGKFYLGLLCFLVAEDFEPGGIKNRGYAKTLSGGGEQ